MSRRANAMKSDRLTLAEIQSRGCAALARELGPVGYVRFMQQFLHGKGDYSKERHGWLDRLTLKDIQADIEAHQRRQVTPKRRKKT